MARNTRGTGCLIALLAVAAVVGYFIYSRFYRAPETNLPPPSGGQLNIHVLDVGQGDAILVRTPSGKNILVDAGNPGQGKTILPRLRALGVNQIDLLVASHAHADHIGAADEVIKGITVKQVVDSGVPNDTKNYEDFLLAVDRNIQEDPSVGKKFLQAEPNQTFTFNDVVLTVLAPTQPLFRRDDLRAGGNEPNANSVILRLDYGDFSMLLTGDAEAQTEDRLIQQGANLRANVLKVGHHGSRYATSEQLLERGRFKDAIISCGYDNLYGHPNQQVIDRLRAAGVNIYRTDLQREITITSNGTEAYQITAAQPAIEDLYTGRQPRRDDSSRSGFIQYGDFGTPRRPTNVNQNQQANSNNRNANRNANNRAREAQGGR